MSKRSPSSSSDDNEDDVDNNNNNKDHYIERGVQNRVSQLEKYCEKLKSENKRLKSELRKEKSTKSGRLSKGGMRTENECWAMRQTCPIGYHHFVGHIYFDDTSF